MVLVDDVVDEERLFEVASLRCLPMLARLVLHRTDGYAFSKRSINDGNDLYLR